MPGYFVVNFVQGKTIQLFLTSEALLGRHEGAEMTTNDKALTRNCDSNKEKSEIDSNIRVLKIGEHSGRRNCILQ